MDDGKDGAERSGGNLFGNDDCEDFEVLSIGSLSHAKSPITIKSVA